MGLFDIFKKQGKNKNFPEEYKSALNFNKKFEALLSADKYIARSDYKHLIEQLLLFIPIRNIMTVKIFSCIYKSN